MKRPLVIYHGNCPDGFTAAWVAARALGDVELFAGSYGEQPPYELAAGRRAYLVDFSYPRAQLEQLNERVASLTVLDHHKTAQAELEGFDDCAKIFDMNRSGAGIAWDYFHDDEPRPWIVDYVEDRDLWRFALPASEEVSLWVRLTPHTLEAFDALSQQSLSSVMQAADGAMKHLQHYVRDAIRNTYVLPNIFEGEHCRCVNVSYTGVSDVLHAALEEDATTQLALAWHLSKERVLRCSVRSRAPYDCSRFAKAYGGGGHAQAAGFQLELDCELARRLLGAA